MDRYRDAAAGHLEVEVGSTSELVRQPCRPPSAGNRRHGKPGGVYAVHVVATPLVSVRDHALPKPDGQYREHAMPLRELQVPAAVPSPAPGGRRDLERAAAAPPDQVPSAPKAS